MFEECNNYYKIDEFEKNGVKAIYTKKNVGNLAYYTAETNEELKQVKDNRDKILLDIGAGNRKLFYAKQIHSDKIKIIRNTDIAKEYDGYDGFITNRNDVVILMHYADCLPIYFYDKSKKIIGICHAGWKGSYKNIGLKLINMMKKEFGSELKDVLIGLGIGIKGCCYETGKEIYEKFNNQFNNSIIEKSFDIRNDKIYFDLEEFNYNLFLEYGIKPENIIKSEMCTYCNEDFFSYRKDADKRGRNGAFIFL
ncbi:peptidoglycan editing factor PgeF [Haliovirga abyssi]|uniref:Purine nucleoside phosphorylase n=1 Tax=Haliovirga abyssi TaxID=2996794 RepID=A0AAU9DIU2_9FUSO|nr:peptidoglycan editing factor PgeF [Haliovirga abyssi]BDU49722.1 laccase domain protein [Haliovirga abyssi]